MPDRFGPGIASAPTAEWIGERSAQIVFADHEARAALEAIVHPAVYERIAAWLAGQRRGGRLVAVADIPLLFETGREGDFDAVVVVACDARTSRSQRLMTRDGLSEAAARARLARSGPSRRRSHVPTS